MRIFGSHKRIVFGILAVLLISVHGRADDLSPGNPVDLARIFSGGEPTSIIQLKAMEQHQRKVVEKVTACTVAIVVGHSHGSGVIVSQDGYILTAAHVSGEPNRTAALTLADGRKVSGKTLGVYRTLDAGLMKIDGKGPWPYAETVENEDVKLGQWCIASGHPGGFQDGRQPVVRIGRVLERDRFAITTDCKLVGGDSGGPLFDMYGRVIGINSRIGTDLTANLHVPVAAYHETWDRLAKSEAWGNFLDFRPYIGVRGDPNADVAKITYVHPNMPAEKAGIEVGDIILRFNSQNVTDFASLQQCVNETRPGDRVVATVLRGERKYRFQIVVGQQDS
jgi:S1-C subfamily serine protease